jgi:phosphoribosylaminoimidazole-succinocarboxamide synthase
MATKTNKLYEGKAKIVYATDSPDSLIFYFKDETTAFDAGKKGTIHRKGIINNQISAKIFEFLESQGIPTHQGNILADREVLVKKVAMFPIEVVIRNRAAGSLCRRFALEEGRCFPSPILEYSYKDDVLKDPMINETHIKAMGLLGEEDLGVVRELALRINECLKKFFLDINLELIDFKIEFGKLNGKVVLADEISPDTCRLWEVGTGQRYDKDRFRRDLGNVEEAYQEVLQRVSR